MDLDVRYDWAENVVSLMSPAAKDQVELTEYDADQEQPAVGLMVVHLGGTHGTDDPGEPQYYACSDVHDPEAAECQSVQHLFAANGTDDGDVERSGRRELFIAAIITGVIQIATRIALDCANIYAPSTSASASHFEGKTGCIFGHDKAYARICRSDCCTNTQKYCTAEYPNSGLFRPGNGEYCYELPNQYSASPAVHCNDYPGATTRFEKHADDQECMGDEVHIGDSLTLQQCKDACAADSSCQYIDYAKTTDLGRCNSDLSECRCYTVPHGCASKRSTTDYKIYKIVERYSRWYDRDGPTYDCAWYGKGTNCASYGHNYTRIKE